MDENQESIAVTDMDSKTRRAMDRICAIVLGGGRGMRLHPLTALRAKPAVPLLGRYRLIDIPLSNCIHSNIKQIFVLTQFNSASLNRHINSCYTFDNFTKGFVEILAAEQTIESGDWFQGTADAVRQNLRHFHNTNPSHYLILSGDQLYRMDYRALMMTHIQKDADITVATLPVEKKNTRHFGIMKAQRNGAIKAFVEKPIQEEQLTNLALPATTLKRLGLSQEDPRYLASMGVYVFRAEVLDQILEEQEDWIDFGKHVIPNSLHDHGVYAHIFSGFWEDIGTISSYYETHMRMVKPNPPFQFYDPGHTIYTHPRFLSGAKIHDAVIRNSIICEGSRIKGAEIADTVIGIRALVHPGARISRSIIMGGDYLENHNQDASVPSVGIGDNSIIDKAIIDKNASIGKNVVIRGSDALGDQEGEGWAVRDGIVVVMKNAVIPDGTRIE